jgi:aldehyde dehydrogenase (NAD+)
MDMEAFDPTALKVCSAHFIGGARIVQKLVLDVSRPSDGAVYAGLPIADAAIVDRAVSNAREAFNGGRWSRAAPRERARLMRRWADLIEADVATLAPLEAVGSTRPVAEVARWDIPYTADCIRFFSELADKIGGEIAATSADRLGMTVTEPYGVIAAIAPWNFPLVMAVTKIAPVLAAGNAVVLKPSEMTPFSVMRLAELAVAAGIPAGIFNIVQGDGSSTGNALCRHPHVSKVTFTGSGRTGAAIMVACAEAGVKPVTLELGGKSPQIVFADAPEMDQVARRIAAAISGNAGQVCVAGSRLIAHKHVVDELVGGIASAFSKLRAGRTWDAGTTLSPIISARQLQRIESIVGCATSAGAEVLCGGHAIDVGGKGAFFAPTILGNVTLENAAIREEIFGPVLTVQTFDDEEEAFALAAHEEFGLAAGVHTADLSRALRAVRRIDSGTIWINRYGRSSDFIIPTGGFKRSGVGKDLGREALQANLRMKSVLIDIAAGA